MLPNKRRLIGICSGSLWLIIASAAFGGMAFAWIATPLARVLLMATVAVAAICAMIDVALLRAAIRLPLLMSPRTAAERAIGRRFGLVFAAEGIGCALVSWLCVWTHHLPLIAAANIAVVGLHFIPLATIFMVPRYFVMGAWMCVVAVVTILAVPPTMTLGHGLAVYAVPSLGSFPVVLVTALAGMREVWIAIKSMDAVSV